MESLGDAYAAADDSNFVPKYTARCHCGAVGYEVGADPVDAKICHCRDCQTLHGAPMQWAAIFHKHDVRLLRGVEHLTFYNARALCHQSLTDRELPCKVACGRCGTLIADEGRRMWLAFPALFDFGTSNRVPQSFQPTCHIFYEQRLMDVADDLPKWPAHKP